MKKKIYWAGLFALSLFFLLAMLVLRLIAARSMVSKVSKESKPRLLWGCTPITNIKYSSDALNQKGYFSRTFVNTYYSKIANKSDYDLYRYELFLFYRWLPKPLVMLIEPYLSFIYLLSRFDIFHFFFDGGVLASSPLRFIEIQLLHWFGKKVIVMPYGADVHVLENMRNHVYRFGQLYNYGQNALVNMKTIKKWIDYFSRRADFCIGSINFDSLYRFDVLPVSYISIDADQWSPNQNYRNDSDGKHGAVSIAHSPNHRMIKGTEYIIDAVNRLRSDGYQIEFHLLEGLKNTEVQRILRECDILVELLICGYGLSGMEGMALGKPVISNFQGDTSVLKYYSYFNECPIVQAGFDTVYEKLKWLVENPTIRQQLGVSSRRYVEKYHSYVSQQIMWGEIYRKVWCAEEVDLMTLFHPQYGTYETLYRQEQKMRERLLKRNEANDR